MFNEANLYDATISEKEIIERAFKSIRMDMDCLFVPLYYLGKLKEILPSRIKLACPVDYPFGLGDTQMRQHACITTANRGADFIDLVVNPIYFFNSEKHKLVEDIQANRKICQERDVGLRVVMDYRMFNDGLIYTAVSVLANLGIRYIIPSTGQFAEDHTDNLIMCQILSNKNPCIKTIYNNISCSNKQYQDIEKADIYGIRLKSFDLVYN